MNNNNENKITIDELHYPARVLIDGEDYYLFCEFNCNDSNKLVKVYARENSNDVVLNYGSYASVGFYSLDSNKVNVLFDRIENSVFLEKGFGLYSLDDMQKHLMAAEALGGKYPIIRNELETGYTKNTIRNRIHQFVSKHRLPAPEYLNEESSLKEVEYLESEINKDLRYDPSVDSKNEETVCVETTADNLPEDWRWIQYHDGSGHLESPDGASWFSYDSLTSCASMNGIEYRKSNSYDYDVFYGSFDEFKVFAEIAINKEFYSIENIPSLLRILEDNAWEGKKPDTINITDGANVIRLTGYIYEPSYECFSSTASVSLNGKTLFGKDSRCVGPYHLESYDTGLYDNLPDALSYIKDKVNVRALHCITAHTFLDSVIMQAKTVSKQRESNEKLNDGRNNVTIDK